MTGGEVSHEVGVTTTIIGTLYGAVNGYFGGKVDAVMMRIVDALLSTPTLFFLLVVGPSGRRRSGGSSSSFP